MRVIIFAANYMQHKKEKSFKGVPEFGCIAAFQGTCLPGLKTMCLHRESYVLRKKCFSQANFLFFAIQKKYRTWQRKT
jgi:hypothetical protein